MGKDLGVKTIINQSHRRVFWDGVPRLGEPICIKFHIQNLEYENEIGELTEDFYVNTFTPYDGILPFIGDKYYHDEKTATYDNKELIQYRVLVKISDEYFFITYLIKVDGIHYKPTYEEDDAQKWIDLIYDNWTMPNHTLHLMCPVWYDQEETQSNAKGINMARKVTLKQPSGLDSILAPENKYFYDTIGRNWSSNKGCDCCKGAKYECAEATPTSIYVLNTSSDYTRIYDDCAIHVELLNYRKGIELTCNKGAVHCIYETCNGKNIHDRTLILRLNNNLIKMLECDDSLKLLGSILGSIARGGIELKIKKGLSFETNPYDNEIHYYPEWVNDETIWVYRQLSLNYYIDYDRETMIQGHDYTRAFNLSNSLHIAQLYELYEEMEQLMDAYLQKGCIDYKNVLVKHNQLDPIGELYEEFENFTNSDKFVRIKNKLIEFINSVNYEDIIPQKIDLVFINGEADEAIISNIIKSDILPNDIALLINKLSDNRINGKYTFVYNENNTPCCYISSNKDLLLKLYHTKYSARRLIEIDQPNYNLYNDIINQDIDYNITHDDTYIQSLKTNPTVKQHYIALSKTSTRTPAIDAFINTLRENLNSQDEKSDNIQG